MAQLVTDQAEVAGPSAARRLGRGSMGFFRLVRHNIAGTIGFVVFMLIVLVSFIGPYFVGENPPNTAQIYQQPSGAHPLGTDYSGRDVLIQIVNGGRPVLVVGFLAAIL